MFTLFSCPSCLGDFDCQRPYADLNLYKQESSFTLRVQSRNAAPTPTLTLPPSLCPNSLPITGRDDKATESHKPTADGAALAPSPGPGGPKLWATLRRSFNTRHRSACSLYISCHLSTGSRFYTPATGVKPAVAQKEMLKSIVPSSSGTAPPIHIDGLLGLSVRVLGLIYPPSVGRPMLSPTHTDELLRVSSERGNIPPQRPTPLRRRSIKQPGRGACHVQGTTLRQPVPYSL